MKKEEKQKKEKKVKKKNEGGSESLLKTLLRYAKKPFVTAVIVILVVSLIYALVANYFVCTNSVRGMITFSFEEINDGQNPDGTPFDTSELLSDDVLKIACEKLDNKLTVREIRSHLLIRDQLSLSGHGVIRQSILDGFTDYSYFPNIYRLTYTIVPDESERKGSLSIFLKRLHTLNNPKPKEVLAAVMEAYEEVYTDSYFSDGVEFTSNWAELDAIDYYYKMRFVESRINSMYDFLTDVYNARSEYVSSLGIGYGDLRKELKQIRDVDFQNYKSFVINHGLAKDRKNLIRGLTYNKLLHADTKDRYNDFSRIYKIGLDAYDATTTKVVFIPSLDIENVFYMNRTKTGADYLVGGQDSSLETANSAKLKQEEYQDLIDHFSNSKAAKDSDYQKADKLLDDMVEKIDGFSETARKVLELDHTTYTYQEVSMEGPSEPFSVTTYAVKVIQTTVITASLLYMIYYGFVLLLEFLRKIREEVEK